jgi:hypothetical protein
LLRHHDYHRLRRPCAKYVLGLLKGRDFIPIAKLCEILHESFVLCFVLSVTRGLLKHTCLQLQGLHAPSFVAWELRVVFCTLSNTRPSETHPLTVTRFACTFFRCMRASCCVLYSQQHEVP